MKNNFTIELKNEKVKSYKKSIIAIIVLNIIFFLILAITSEINKIKLFSILLIGLLLSSFAIQYYLQKKNNTFNAVLTSIIFIIFTHLFLQFWWQALAMAIISLFYYYAIRKLQLSISKDGISYPSFPPKNIEWMELNNLILKDHLLTIDFKSNKLVQAEIKSDEKDVVIDEKDFNDFCRQQLNK